MVEHLEGVSSLYDAAALIQQSSDEHNLLAFGQVLCRGLLHVTHISFSSID